MSRPDASEAAFVETPRGIFTAAGVWFHTTERSLREYGGAAVDRVGLERLLALAAAWLDAPRTFTLWLLPLVLFAGPVVGGGAALAWFLAWSIFGPAAATPAGAALARRLSGVLLQGAYFVVVLSVLAGTGATAAAAVGLVGFVLLRWGIAARVVRPLVAAVHRRLFPLPAADQVLRGLLVRFAIRYGTPPPDVRRMERDLVSAMQRRT